MILDEIISCRKMAVKELKKELTVEQLLGRIEENHFKSLSFKAALQGQGRGMNIIAEVKKASPSKGLICPNFDYLAIAKAYEEGGATAISVLTEPQYFQGCNTYLSEIKQAVSLPVLRKDFIIDSFQIYESKAIGADAILLIVAALTDRELTEYIQLATSLGLDVLVETHNEEEVQRALAVEADIIGVNNRDLRDFSVDLATSERLAKFIPPHKLFVSESGIHTKEDSSRLKAAGASALLIGESVVKSANSVEQLKALRLAE